MMLMIIAAVISVDSFAVSRAVITSSTLKPNRKLLMEEEEEENKTKRYELSQLFLCFNKLNSYERFRGFTHELRTFARHFYCRNFWIIFRFSNIRSSWGKGENLTRIEKCFLWNASRTLSELSRKIIDPSCSHSSSLTSSFQRRFNLDEEQTLS